jgi:predicted O-linked N-acetylglucosamine transferase (SPINDLY family)
MRTKLWIAGAVLIFILQNSPAQEKMTPLVIHNRADMSSAVDQIQADLATLNQHHEDYRKAAEKLAGLYASLNQKAEAVVKAAQVIKSDKSSSSSVSQLLTATQQMQETQMSFNLQYLQLQEQMQNENRQFTLLSNIMKTKQDTMKNSISNLK